jgi:hypothetical protein
MRIPVAAELLDLWEAGSTQPTWDWSLAFISLCFPEDDLAALDRMTLGERDARLLDIREALFGRRLNGCSVCPACGARVEMDLKTSDVRVVPAPTTRVSEIENGEWRVQFRVPTAGDLCVAAETGEVDRIRQSILERCVLRVERAGEAADFRGLPAETLNTVVGRMAECDPQADVHFQLRCLECSNTWSEGFDITSYLWTELEAWSQRTLHDIHRLALAYGWREADVLAVSSQRRACYLEMIGS